MTQCLARYGRQGIVVLVPFPAGHPHAGQGRPAQIAEVHHEFIARPALLPVVVQPLQVHDFQPDLFSLDSLRRIGSCFRKRIGDDEDPNVVQRLEYSFNLDHKRIDVVGLVQLPRQLSRGRELQKLQSESGGPPDLRIRDLLKRFGSAVEAYKQIQSVRVAPFIRRIGNRVTADLYLAVADPCLVVARRGLERNALVGHVGHDVSGKHGLRRYGSLAGNEFLCDLVPYGGLRVEKKVQKFHQTAPSWASTAARSSLPAGTRPRSRS